MPKNLWNDADAPQTDGLESLINTNIDPDEPNVVASEPFELNLSTAIA